MLRLVDALPEPEVAAPRVVGVDEYATRKSRHYGTFLVDIETRRPIDLLADREASSLPAWLAERPGVEVICRDRAPFFTEGAAAGAPQAVRVADRWHLWHNLSEAAERAVAQHRRCLRTLVPAVPEPDPEPAPEEESPGSPWSTGHRFADRTRARHADVHALLDAGHSRRSIQRQLGMTWRTVNQLADATAPEDLFTGQWQNRPSVLDGYKPYLEDRWNEGFTNAWRLWEEIVPLGYKGSYSTPSPATSDPSPSCSSIDRASASRTGSKPSGRTTCPASTPSLPGIGRDLDAVTAGLTLSWSSGAVEGHVNRIKMLKRQMFGRAGFHLLRKRVLLA